MDNILDYAKPESKPFPWRWSAYLAFGGWWGSVILGPLWIILLPAALIGSVALGCFKKWRVLALSLILSPMALSAGWGMVEYARGTATIRGMGLMRGPSNVDPVSGMQYSSGGCVVSGNEWMTQEPYNLAAQTLVSCFGKMPGAYDGPYPSEADAYAALVGAVPLDLKLLKTDRVAIAGTSISLRTGLGGKILEGFREGPATDINDAALLAQYGQPQAAIYSGRCIILAIPATTPAPATEHRALILVDAKTGKAFAIYRTRLDFRPRWDTIWR